MGLEVFLAHEKLGVKSMPFYGRKSLIKYNDRIFSNNKARWKHMSMSSGVFLEHDML